MAFAALVSFVAVTKRITVPQYANAPGSVLKEIFETTFGVTRPITATAIRLREPAIASGVQSIDLIRMPPSDHKIAAARRSRTFLFKDQWQCQCQCRCQCRSPAPIPDFRILTPEF